MPYTADDFDLGGVEEYYSPRKLQLISCDNCKERVPSRSVHFMNSFQHPDVEVVLCARCYGKMKGKR